MKHLMFFSSFTFISFAFYCKTELLGANLIIESIDFQKYTEALTLFPFPALLVISTEAFFPPFTVTGTCFTLARLYSQDPGSSRKGGELGMASKSIFWPAFSDAAMSLKPGVVSQIVETPDGFHIIEVLEKKGDMFNARHILLKPEYTSEDRTKAFQTLDSLKTELLKKTISQ